MDRIDFSVFLCRDHCVALWSGEDVNRGHSGVDYQKELSGALYQRCQRAAVEVPVSGHSFYTAVVLGPPKGFVWYEPGVVV